LTFQTAAFVSVIPIALLLLSGSSGESLGKGRETSKITLKESFRAILEPELAIIVIVALFMNVLHQMGSIFISLYGLAVGMSLTQIGVIRAAYAGCNAVTRPISGHVVDRFGHRRLSYFGLPLQSAVLMLIPLFTGFGTLLTVYVLSGFMRAVVIVANAAGLVQEVPESKVRRGVASGIFNAAGDIGNILGPALGGFIAQATSLGGVFVIGPLGSTIVFLLGIWAVRRKSVVKR
jgi:MFS family permease